MPTTIRFSTRTRTRVRRSLATLQAAALGAALAVAAAPGGPPQTAAAITPAAVTITSTSLSAGTTKVTSSSGKALSTRLSAYKGGGYSSLSLTMANRSGTESHIWNFNMPASALAIKSTGAGSLRTTAAGSYASVSLSVVARDTIHVQTCKGVVTSKWRPVTVKGVFVLRSGTTSWGRVGSKTFTFAAPSRVTWTTSGDPSPCYGGSTTTPCSYGLWWSVYRGRTSISAYKPNGATVASLSAYRSVPLSKPAGASRFDFLTAKTNVPKLTVSSTGAARLNVSSGRTGVIGSAVLRSPTRQISKSTCGTSNTPYATDGWWSASYTNGSTRFTVKAAVFGSISVANNTSNASITRTRPLG